jgi:SAM-dependent methyltransferase
MRVDSISVRSAARHWWRDRRTRVGTLAALVALASELLHFLLESTPARERRRYGDMEYDWDHRVNTTSAALGWRNRLMGVFQSPYQPTEPSLFHEMISSLDIDHRDYIFIDLGSGKGRTLLLASDYPFRSIVGVELLPELDAIAQANIEKTNSSNRKCGPLESRCGDARAFTFPAGAILLYLFNPFLESALAEVVARLEQSLSSQPRPAVILYHNPLLAHVLDKSSLFRKTAGTSQYSVYRNRESQIALTVSQALR